MKQVWQTVDGRVFNDELDAAKYEQSLFTAHMQMIDFDGNITDKCSQTFLVHLISDQAAEIFIAMNAADPDSVSIPPEDISEGDTGWWFWSMNEERYIAISDSDFKRFSKFFGAKN